MAPKGWCSRLRRERMRAWLTAAWAAAVLLASPLDVWAGGVAGQAGVDQRAVQLGRPFVLTISLSGDLTGVQGEPAFDVPEGLHISSRRQVTDLSVGPAGISRSLNFVYVLVPTKPGTFQLGPFAIQRQDQRVMIDAVEVIVQKPRLPPFLAPQSRYIL